MRKLSLDDRNPYLLAQGIHLFADHFDPIRWLAASFAKLGPPPYGAVGLEALMMLLGVAPLFTAAANGYVAQRAAVLLAVLTLSNVGAVTAVHYPPGYSGAQAPGAMPAGRSQLPRCGPYSFSECGPCCWGQRRPTGPSPSLA